MNFTQMTTIGAVFAGLLIAAASPAQATARSTVKVINDSSKRVVSIYSSPRHRTEYGDIDLLGRHVLRPGYNVKVDFNTDDAENECWQDVMAKASDGSKWTKTMNICRESTWTLVD